MASETEHKEINDCDELRTAVEECKNKPHDDNWERYLINRSVQLGCTEHIPDDWGIA